MEKELYPVFCVDVCFTPYAMENVLIGAKNKKDLMENPKFEQILNDLCIGITPENIDEIKIEDFRIEEMENIYTDKPYTVLKRFSYYE